MKKVCVNRLKADVDKLQYFVNSMEHQEETLEQLFQCILRLFDNEVAHGNPNSVHGYMNATNGLLNSQSQSSIFNSKANISGLGLDSVGMSFGKQTDDGHHHQGFRKVLTGQNNNLANLNRQYNSDRNVFARPSNVTKERGKINLSPLQELESEVVNMGELLPDSHDQKDLQFRMTSSQQKAANKQALQDSSPRFPESSPTDTKGQLSQQQQKQQQQQNRYSSCKKTQQYQVGCVDSDTYVEDQKFLEQQQNLFKAAQTEQRNRVDELQYLQETPSLKVENSSQGQQQNQNQRSGKYQVSGGAPGAQQPTSACTASYMSPIFNQIGQGQRGVQTNQVVQDSHDSISASQLFGNLSQKTHQSIRGSHQGGLNSGRSFKEVLKIFVQMMVEDISVYYEGFSWQKKVLLQSEEKKKKRKKMVAQNVATNIVNQKIATVQQQQHQQNNLLSPTSQTKTLKIPIAAGKATAQQSNNEDEYRNLGKPCGWQGLKPAASQQCPHESKVYGALSHLVNPLCHSDSSDSYPPSHASDKQQPGRHSVDTSSQQEVRRQLIQASASVGTLSPQSQQQKIPSYQQCLEGAKLRQTPNHQHQKTNSLQASKQSSIISNNYKMDFIDPGKTGTGMLSARNNYGNGRSAMNTVGGGVTVPTELCQRFVELAPNGSNHNKQPQLQTSCSQPRYQTATAHQVQANESQSSVTLNDPTRANLDLNRAKERGFVFISDQRQQNISAETSKSEEHLARKKRLIQPENGQYNTQAVQRSLRGPYHLEMGQGKQSPTYKNNIKKSLEQDGAQDYQDPLQQEQQQIDVVNPPQILSYYQGGRQINQPSPLLLKPQKSSVEAVKRRYNNNQDFKLTFTTNSMVSPADLEAASDNEAADQQHYKTISSTNPVDHNAIIVNLDKVAKNPRYLTQSRNSSSNNNQHQSQESWPLSGTQVQGSKDGPSSSNEMSPEMTRRLLQNVAAIEKDLNLAPTVSKQIGTIHEEDERECELSDTQKTQNEKRKNMFSNDQLEMESPEFPKTNHDMSEKRHKSLNTTEQESHRQPISDDFNDQTKLQIGGDMEDDERFEDHIMNSFGGGDNTNNNDNQSRKYIDDMTSSSGNLSGYSENADCLPIVEQVIDAKTQSNTHTQLHSPMRDILSQGDSQLKPHLFNDMQDSFAHIEGGKEIALEPQYLQVYSEDQVLPKPNRSSSNQDYTSMVKEINEKDYEQILTDKTRKQYAENDSSLQTPSRKNKSIKDDRTTERKSIQKKQLKQNGGDGGVLVPIAPPPVERSQTHRQMQTQRPIVQHQNTDKIEQRREQPLSMLLKNNYTGSTVIMNQQEENQSQISGAIKTQHETADQIVNQYQQMNFMPQKNQGKDRLEILQKSREFNPVIEFDTNSPFSSQQQLMGSSRGNSDIPDAVQSASLNTTDKTNSQNFTQKVGIIMPFQHAAPEPVQAGNQVVKRQQQQMVQKSQESVATQKTYQNPKAEIRLHELTQQNQHTKTANTDVTLSPIVENQKIVLSASQGLGAGVNNKINVSQPRGPQIIDTPSLPPMSPNISQTKSVGKKYSAATRQTGKISSTSHKQQTTQYLNLNKKMMQADQQLAFSKQQKKLQNLSASAAADKLIHLSNNNNNIMLGKSVSQFGAPPALNSLSSTQTPKNIKGKLSKQFQTLSNTINQGMLQPQSKIQLANSIGSKKSQFK